MAGLGTLKQWDWLLAFLLLGLPFSCASQSEGFVEMAVAGADQDMGSRLDPGILRAARMPESWILDAWLEKREIGKYPDWILVCPLRRGEPVARACLRAPTSVLAGSRVLAVEGGERVWPGQVVQLVSCGLHGEPFCRELGASRVLGRSEQSDDQGRPALRLELSAKQQALLGPRNFVASLSDGAGFSGPAPEIVDISSLLDTNELLLLHSVRMDRLIDTLRAWGRSLPGSKEERP